MNWECKIPKDACNSCVSNTSGTTVMATKMKVLDQFDGLCLDCMDKTRPKLKSVDEDYWRHDDLKVWDTDCRISHGQSTWYFSFMGRKADFKAHRARQLAEKIHHN